VFDPRLHAKLRRMGGTFARAKKPGAPRRFASIGLAAGLVLMFVAACGSETAPNLVGLPTASPNPAGTRPAQSVAPTPLATEPPTSPAPSPPVVEVSDPP